MDNKLQISKQQMLELIRDAETKEMIKPLVESIQLIDTYVAGLEFEKHAPAIDGLQTDEELVLKHIPSKFDDNEIHLYRNDDTEMGRLPEKDEPILAKLLDGGKRLTARVLSCTYDKGRPDIRIRIFMKDI